MSYPPDTRTLIDELLAEQGRLTAVDRFARRYEAGEVPAQARYYRALLPATPPGPGEQYAFAVDLDVCTGCKACVSACHSLNGLDDGETWRDVGVLIGGSVEAPYQQTVTTACHHCVEPACAEGCPVLAYEKDEETGIVRHLDDQCIGCQYCMLKCPYEVPKYSETRGIVRKCDMCHNRLSAGEAPACVQACPTGAIAIRIVSKQQIRELSTPEAQLLPGTFTSEYTKPSTSYTTRRSIPLNSIPGDAASLRLAHAHWPLIAMLLLTQLAVGMYVSIGAIVLAARESQTSIALMANVSFGMLQLGLAVSVLHLGRPLGAWRAFLGLRRSWMSREIVGFGAFAAVAFGLSGVTVLPFATRYFPELSSLGPSLTAFPLLELATLGSVVLGLISVLCSAMIYVDTRRPFWAGPITGIKFFGTALLLGTAAAAVTLSWEQMLQPELAVGIIARRFAIAATVIQPILFGWEAANFREGFDERSPTYRSTLTMWRMLKPLVFARLLLFAGSTGFGVAAILTHGKPAAICATVAFTLRFVSQTIERYFFFTAVDAPKMPGGLAL